jgi:hypothetical protein
VQQAIFPHLDRRLVKVFMVWLKIFPVDTLEAAQGAAQHMGAKRGLHQFYDPSAKLGRIVAAGLGAETGKVAWDTYLFYPPTVDWGAKAPDPMDWVSQLEGSRWVEQRHRARGHALTRRLTGMARNIE